MQPEATSEMLQMNEAPRARGPHLLTGLLLGGLIGLVAALAAPRPYVAEVGLLFPTLNAATVKEVTKSLKLDASDVDWGKSNGVSDSQLLESARVILSSRAAVESGLKEAKISLPPTLALIQGDPVEAFRRDDLVLSNDGLALRLKVSYPRADGARSLCQGLLNYYSTFVHEHRLSNTARTRQQLEEKLVRVDRRLSALERKLLLSAENRFRPLADSKLPNDSKVMRELWKQRILEGGSSGRVLDEMRRIRKEASQDQPEEENQDVGEDWRSRWGSTTLESTEAREGSLPRTSRAADLPSRLELERVYEETLLLYNSALLQWDFLSMWEGLENFDFEIVDPISTHQLPAGQRIPAWSLAGALIGFWLAWLKRRAQGAFSARTKIS